MFSMDQAIELLQSVPEIVGDDPDDIHFKVGVIILTRLGRRKDTFNTARMTGYDESFVSQVRSNLRAAGVWSLNPKDEKTYLMALPDDQNFLIALVMAILCGAGDVICVRG